ncbi:MAG: hypothetical protein ABC527_06860 [Candidatus Methanosuratincola petrocarbonis]
MKKGLYKCAHCGHIAFRNSSGKNENGTAMGLRCEKCQFDTMEHESWWLAGADQVVGAQEEYFRGLELEFAEARKRLGVQK